MFNFGLADMVATRVLLLYAEAVPGFPATQKEEAIAGDVPGSREGRASVRCRSDPSESLSRSRQGPAALPARA
jgi:hypothetical protein